MDIFDQLSDTIGVNQSSYLLTDDKMSEFEVSLDQSRPFHGDYFHHFNEYYTPIHGYISLIVCVFGIIANILNIVVLTR